MPGLTAAITTHPRASKGPRTVTNGFPLPKAPRGRSGGEEKRSGSLSRTSAAAAAVTNGGEELLAPKLVVAQNGLSSSSASSDAERQILFGKETNILS